MRRPNQTSRHKMRAIGSCALLVFLLSLVVFAHNPLININMAYADEHNDNKSNKVKNQSLISDMSDQVANIGSNKAAVKQVLQTIQTQIAQIAGQDKATKTIKQINSIVELNPAGRLSQSLLSLAKQQAAGNIDAVNQATIQIAKFVADGGDYVGQPLEQTGTSPVLQSSSPSSSSPYSSTSILASPPPSLSPTPTPQITSGIPPNASPGQQPIEKIQPQQILIQPSNNNNMTNIGQSSNTIIKPIISYPQGSSNLLPDASSLLPNATTTNNFNNQNIPTNSLSATLASPTSSSTNSNIPPVANISHSIPDLTIAKSSHVMAPPKAYATTHITLPPSHVDISPVAIVGPDLTVDRVALVILDGSASHDRDHDPLTFAWTQTGGPAVMLNDSNTARATFTAPSNLVGDTSLFFRLTVTDKAGLTDSAVKKVTIRRDLSSSPPLSSSHSNSGVVDKFGIRELYPTKPGGEEWFMNMQNPRSDPRNNPPVITKNPDGSFKVQQDQASWGVFTSLLFHPNQITTYNQRQLATKGYMQSPNDWKNVEMTGYAKINNPGDSYTHFTWYARGGRHTSSQPCEGTSIKGDLYNDGGTGFTKEQWHPGGYSFTDKVQAAGSIVGKWVGFKTVIYNFQENGKTVVREQNWIDKNNDNNWVKIFDFVDRGGIGSQGIHCGGSQDQIITWGGPIATFKWDRMPDVDIKNLSVREIQGA
ncbi:MAG: hypothetical protein JO297_16550 [Nitrososphaeraceae archaeon]|nr:hypothetical protein [Nitrososphaeraceae archaeon]